MTNHSRLEIRPAVTSDASALTRIYNYYVKETTITFEEVALQKAEMTARLQEIHSANLPWLVAELAGEIVGYAYATKWKGRCAYRFSVEVTVYLDQHHVGRGIGSMLYQQLLITLHSDGFHVAIGGIALPNEASAALHQKFGFVKVAHFREVGFKFNKWIDVGYWEKIL